MSRKSFGKAVSLALGAFLLVALTDGGQALAKAGPHPSIRRALNSTWQIRFSLISGPVTAI